MNHIERIAEDPISFQYDSWKPLMLNPSTLIRLSSAVNR